MNTAPGQHQANPTAAAASKPATALLWRDDRWATVSPRPFEESCAARKPFESVAL